MILVVTNDKREKMFIDWTGDEPQTFGSRWFSYLCIYRILVITVTQIVDKAKGRRQKKNPVKWVTSSKKVGGGWVKIILSNSQKKWHICKKGGGQEFMLWFFSEDFGKENALFFCPNLKPPSFMENERCHYKIIQNEGLSYPSEISLKH